MQLIIHFVYVQACPRMLYSPHELQVVSVGGEDKGEGRSCQHIHNDVILWCHHMSSLVTLTLTCMHGLGNQLRMLGLQKCMIGCNIQFSWNQINFQRLHFKEMIIEVRSIFNLLVANKLIIKCNIQLSIYTR